MLKTCENYGLYAHEVTSQISLSKLIPTILSLPQYIKFGNVSNVKMIRYSLRSNRHLRPVVNRLPSSVKKSTLPAAANFDTTATVCHSHSNSNSNSNTVVFEFPVRQEGVQLFIANDGKLEKSRPGNGGMRLLNYETEREAIDDAIRLAEGMTHKHNCYNTGFSGAKLVVRCSKGQTPKTVDRAALMEDAADALEELNGTVWTGCDINTTAADMDKLVEQTPYVLAGIGSQVDTNVATAMTTIGSILGVADCYKLDLSELTFLVQGCGKVGSVVAKSLVGLGAKRVYTADILQERARIDGCTPLRDGEEWQEVKGIDFLVPCGNSLAIDERVVDEMEPPKFVVGATNQPYKNATVRRLFDAKGVLHVPESISSGGAILADSIEWTNPGLYKSILPSRVYDWIIDLSREKSSYLVERAEKKATNIDQVIDDVYSDADNNPVGKSFPSWIEENYSSAAFPSAGRHSGTSNRHSGTSNYSSHSFGRGFATVSKRSFSSLRSSNADVAIIGAGINGMNIAYQLKRRDPTMKIRVFEQAPALGYGSSGYSTGFLRALYSFDETMQLALDGINAYKNWQEYTNLSSPQAEFTHTGALWMLGKTKAENIDMADRLEQFGVGSEVMDAKAVEERWPVLDTAPMPSYDTEGNEIPFRGGEFSAVYEEGCGHMDSNACLNDMKDVLDREGVDVQFNAKVGKLNMTSGDSKAVTGLTLVDGTVVNSKIVINAAGPWFDKINKPAGVTTTTEMLPTRIQVGHKNIEGEFLDLPFVADCHGNSGVYFMPRKSNKQLVFGSIAHRFESEVVDPDEYNQSLDPEFKQDYLNCLFHRMPTLPRSGEIHGFSHMYTVNQDDVHPVLGPSKSAEGLYLCHGESGHGFKLAPAVGSLMAQSITGGDKVLNETFETDVDIDFMHPDREPLSLQVKTHFA